MPLVSGTRPKMGMSQKNTQSLRPQARQGAWQAQPGLGRPLKTAARDPRGRLTALVPVPGTASSPAFKAAPWAQTQSKRRPKPADLGAKTAYGTAAMHTASPKDPLIVFPGGGAAMHCLNPEIAKRGEDPL